MTCHNCRIDCRKFGKRKNRQRYQCTQLREGVHRSERQHPGRHVPAHEKAEIILRAILEGNSVSSVVRLFDVHPTTILKLLVIAGETSERIMAQKIRNVQVRDVELDEVWSFIFKKQKPVRPEDDPNFGDCYTFFAIERHSKLVLNIAMGKRDQATTDVFIEGLRQATANCHFQVTSDGFTPYRSAVTTTLSDRVDFAQLIKVYSNPQDARIKPIVVRTPEDLAKTMGLSIATLKEWQVQHALLRRLKAIMHREKMTHARIALRAGTSPNENHRHPERRPGARIDRSFDPHHRFAWLPGQSFCDESRYRRIISPSGQQRGYRRKLNGAGLRERLGYKRIPVEWTGGIATLAGETFNYTDFSFNTIVASAEKASW